MIIKYVCPSVLASLSRKPISPVAGISVSSIPGIGGEKLPVPPEFPSTLAVQNQQNQL